MFNPHLKMGEEINKARLREMFGCSLQGGMHKSNKTYTRMNYGVRFLVEIKRDCKCLYCGEEG